MNNKNWDNYYNITRKSTPPRKTLIKAIQILDKENNLAATKFAIDLGCGAGADTVALLKHNWSVLAIDSQATAITTLISSCPQLLQDKLTTKVASFESLTSLPTCQLINASYSLPFLKPEYVQNFWEIMLQALNPGGIFSGIFFGINDSWNTLPNMTFLSSGALHNLFNAFKIEFLEEEEKNEIDALGNMKHSHKYFIVAKRK